MTQSKYTGPDNTSQTASAYKTNIDNAFEVNLRGPGAMFQAHEQDTPDMTVRLEAGSLWSGPGNAATEVAAQDSSTITAPVTNPRIDRIVVHQTTGAVSTITGTESTVPVAPSVTASQIPICQVALATSTTSVTNSLITDERPTYIGNPTGSSSFLANVVEDTTPQLGGPLDVNGQEIQSSGDVVVQLGDAAGSNELQIEDSGGTEVASIDSDGNIEGTTLSLDGGTNTMATYEEGTFTPVAEGASVTGAGTYDHQVGRYTRVGKFVTVNFNIRWTAHTGSGTLRLAGLPYNIKNLSNYVPSTVGTKSDGSNFYVIGVEAQPNTAYATAFTTTAGADPSSNDTVINGDQRYRFSFTYETD